MRSRSGGRTRSRGDGLPVPGRCGAECPAASFQIYQQKGMGAICVLGLFLSSFPWRVAVPEARHFYHRCATIYQAAPAGSVA